MLRRKQLLDYIGVKLAHLKACVELLNGIGFFDLNTVSEDFFAELLSEVFGLTLANLNHVDLNHVAIDLADPTERFAVQVTSSRKSRKIQKTIDKFVEHGLGEHYDRLKVLVIGRRTGAYRSLKVPESIGFVGASDVVDLHDLLQLIKGLDLPALARVQAIVAANVTDSFSIATSSELTSGQDHRRDRVALEEFWGVVGLFWGHFRVLLHAMYPFTGFKEGVPTIFALWVRLTDSSVEIDEVTQNVIREIYSFDWSKQSRAYRDPNGSLIVSLNPAEAISEQPISWADWFIELVDAVGRGCTQLLTRYGGSVAPELIECISLMENRSKNLTGTARHIRFAEIREADLSLLWGFFERAVLSTQLIQKLRPEFAEAAPTSRIQKAAMELSGLVSPRLELLDDFFDLAAKTVPLSALATGASHTVHSRSEIGLLVDRHARVFLTDHLQSHSHASANGKILSWEELLHQELSDLARGCAHILARYADCDKQILESTTYLRNWTQGASTSLHAHLAGLFQPCGPTLPSGSLEVFRGLCIGLLECHHLSNQLAPRGQTDETD